MREMHNKRQLPCFRFPHPGPLPEGEGVDPSCFEPRAEATGFARWLTCPKL